MNKIINFTFEYNLKIKGNLWQKLATFCIKPEENKANKKGK